MCGIWFLLSMNDFKEEYFKSFNNIKSRGPDYFSFKSINTNLNNVSQYLNIGFHRLSIMDTTLNGSQPFELNNNDRTIYSMCNGEIYNYKELIAKYDLKCESLSDCEVIPKLYEKIGFHDMLTELRGEYAICIIDFKNEEEFEIYLGRDQTE